MLQLCVYWPNANRRTFLVSQGRQTAAQKPFSLINNPVKRQQKRYARGKMLTFAPCVILFVYNLVMHGTLAYFATTIDTLIMLIKAKSFIALMLTEILLFH